jgi:hypothetical protein
LKDGYPKLTLFKVWVHFCKSDEKSRVIGEFLPKLNEYFSFFLKKKKKIALIKGETEVHSYAWV